LHAVGPAPYDRWLLAHATPSQSAIVLSALEASPAARRLCACLHVGCAKVIYAIMCVFLQYMCMRMHLWRSLFFPGVVIIDLVGLGSVSRHTAVCDTRLHQDVLPCML
jgi:hypothetical protein